jgi:hypothetical protein
VQTATCIASNGYSYTCRANQRCVRYHEASSSPRLSFKQCPGRDYSALCSNGTSPHIRTHKYTNTSSDSSLICCPNSNLSCSSVSACCGSICCTQGAYCTSSLTCAFRSTTISQPSTSSTRAITTSTGTRTLQSNTPSETNVDGPKSGLSRSDKIAIAVGLGVGIPSIIISFITM